MDLIQRALPEFLAGARDTFIYCITSFPLALLLGMLLALMSSSRLLLLRGPARTFIEIIRSTPILVQLFFLSVDRGQTEAALSLGLTPSQNFFRVVLPQAIPLMIPPFVNDFIYMLKDSAIVSAIAGTELTSVLSTWVTHNGSNPIPLYTLAIILYLLLSLPTSYVARFFEKRLRAAL